MIGDTPIGLILAWIAVAAALGLVGVIVATPSLSLG